MDAQEPQNAAAQALRDLEGLRGVNRELRSVPQPEEAPPPLTDDEIIEEFRRTTGKIINANGEVIGEDPTWSMPEGAPTRELPPGEFIPIPPRPRDIDASSEPEKIDLLEGYVRVGGVRYQMTDAERTAVALFALDVMANRINESLEKVRARLAPRKEPSDAPMQPVSPDAPSGGLQQEGQPDQG